MYIHTQRKCICNAIFGTEAEFKVRNHAASYKKGAPYQVIHLWEAKPHIFNILVDLEVVNGFNANIAARELSFQSKNKYFRLENTEDISDSVVLDDETYYYGIETIIISADVEVNNAVRTDMEISPVVIEEGYY